MMAAPDGTVPEPVIVLGQWTRSSSPEWCCVGHARLPWGMIAWAYADGSFVWNGFRFPTWEAVYLRALAYEGS